MEGKIKGLPAPPQIVARFQLDMRMAPALPSQINAIFLRNFNFLGYGRRAEGGNWRHCAA